MDRGPHHFPRIHADNLALAAGHLHEVVVLTYLHIGKGVSNPPFAAETQRRSESIVWRPRVEPPFPAIREAHGTVASNRLAAPTKATDLIFETPRVTVVVIVEECDNLSASGGASGVSSRPDCRLARKVQVPHSRRNQILHRSPARHQQNLPIPVRLMLCASNRVW